MDIQEITNQVIATVQDTLGVTDRELTPQTSLKDLGADSFDQLEIMVALEETFGISFEDAPGADLSQLTTIQAVVDTVASLL